MNFKIVETKVDYPDVLVYRDINGGGDQQVLIHAFGKQDDDEDVLIYEIVDFPNAYLAKNFVRDFSKESANKFCEKNNLKYE